MESYVCTTRSTKGNAALSPRGVTCVSVLSYLGITVAAGVGNGLAMLDMYMGLACWYVQLSISKYPVPTCAHDRLSIDGTMASAHQPQECLRGEKYSVPTARE